MKSKIALMFMLFGLASVGLADTNTATQNGKPAIDYEQVFKECKEKYSNDAWIPIWNNCDQINREMVKFLCNDACLDARTCFIQGSGPDSHTTAFIFIDGGKKICWADYGEILACADWEPGKKLDEKTIPENIKAAINSRYGDMCETVVPELPLHPGNDPESPSKIAPGLQACYDMCAVLMRANMSFCNNPRNIVGDNRKRCDAFVKTGLACNDACEKNCNVTKCGIKQTPEDGSPNMGTPSNSGSVQTPAPVIRRKRP